MIPKENLSNRTRRELCITHTISSLNPSVYDLFGVGNEHRKFIQDKITTPINGGTLEISSKEIEDLLKSYKEIANNDPGYFTDGRIHDIYAAGESVKKQAYMGLYKAGKDLGLEQTLPIEELLNQVKDPRYLEINLRPSEYRSLFASEYSISITTENEVLLMRYDERKIRRGELDFVSMDDLFRIKPELVQSKLISYYKASVLTKLSFLLSFNLDLHKIPSAQSIPNYVKELMKLGDKETEDVINDINTFFMMLLASSTTYNDGISHALYDYAGSGLSEKISQIGRSYVYLDSYLKHLAECPSSDISLSNDKINLITKRFRSVLYETYRRGRDGNKIMGSFFQPHLDVLSDPRFHAPTYRENIRRRAEQNRNREEKLIKFIDENRNETDVNEVVRRLKETDKNLFEELNKFIEVLGRNYFGKSEFDKLLSGASESLLYQSVEMVEYQKGFNRQLGFVNYEAKKSDFIYGGRFSSSRDTEYLIRNSDLNDLVVFLSLIHAKSRERKTDKIDNNISRLTDQLIKKRKDRNLNHSLQLLHRLEEAREKSKKFEEETKISQKLIDKVVNFYATKDNDWDSRDDVVSMNITLTLIYLSKVSNVDLRAPAFRDTVLAILNRYFDESKWYKVEEFLKS